MRARALAAVLGLLAIAGCAKGDATPPDVETIYKNGCARCHGEDGVGSSASDMLGNPGPRNFTEASFQRERTDAQLHESITNGKRGMPAFGGMFTPAQIDELVGKVRSFGPKPRPAASASAPRPAASP